MRSQTKRQITRAIRTNFKKLALLSSLYGLSALVLFLGLSVCLMKSPVEKATEYQLLAQHYEQQLQDHILTPEAISYLLQQKRAVLAQAISLTPYNSSLWADFSDVLRQMDQSESANQAAETAFMLGNEEPPLGRHNLRPHQFILSQNFDTHILMR